MGYAAMESLVESFVNRRMDHQGAPIPLKSTAYDVEIAAGLAIVKLVRLFRNDEQHPIEATITFPVPFDAVVTEIKAQMEGRTLLGRAKARAAARDSYEDAIDRGKPAALHEELLRGLHMLSVANVGPGVEIQVTATFATPLSQTAGVGRLRIPVTVGQIYGDLALPDSDALITGGPVEEAILNVRSRQGTVLLGGRHAIDGRTIVTLDRPIELEIAGEPAIFSQVLVGRAADGRQVSLAFRAVDPGKAVLDADLLLDVSGSMKAQVSADSLMSQWDAVKNGLTAASRMHLSATDRIAVWVFSNDCRKVGSASGADIAGMVSEIPFDNGGTELARAIAAVAASRRNTNVLLVTDGQSGNTIDVQGAVATGARFTVVLVGAGALETNVGYLAALTGGQMFVTQGAEIEPAIVAAIASMRDVASPAEPFDGGPTRIVRRIAGAEIQAIWAKADEKTPAREGVPAAIGAYAASLAIPGMNKELAAGLAEAEGIVGHLTSLVLVDEAADAVSDIPRTRKVALAAPLAASALLRKMPVGASFSQASPPEPAPGFAHDRAAAPSKLAMGMGGLGEEVRAALPGRSGVIDVRTVGGRVSWDSNARALMSGDVRELDRDVRLVLERVSLLEKVSALAASLGRLPLIVAVALLAKADEKWSRTAARFSRSIFRSADRTLLLEAMEAVGLRPRPHSAAEQDNRVGGKHEEARGGGARMNNKTFTPGEDAKVISDIARRRFDGFAAMFEYHGWPERGSDMMRKVQSRVAETYGSVRAFEEHFRTERGG